MALVDTCSLLGLRRFQCAVCDKNCRHCKPHQLATEWRVRKVPFTAIGTKKSVPCAGHNALVNLAFYCCHTFLCKLCFRLRKFGEFSHYFALAALRSGPIFSGSFNPLLAASHSFTPLAPNALRPEGELIQRN